MEDKQMRRYPFFSKDWSFFSINLENPKSSIKSLRYAVDSMQRDNACMFIYPEGNLHPSLILNLNLKMVSRGYIKRWRMLISYP
ncbi:MAG: hypothetical protein BalsKO_13380 [Balneolaceae bacterium]